MEKSITNKRSHQRIGSQNNPLQVKVKKLYKDSQMPTYANETDAGMDLHAHSKVFDAQIGDMVYGTGIAVEIPKGYVGLVFPSSSVYKTFSHMANSVGVIDSGYRGEVMVRFAMSNRIVKYKRLIDRIKNFLSNSAYAPVGTADIEVVQMQGCTYNVGDRIAQLIIMPYQKVQLIEAEELTDSGLEIIRTY